MFASNSSQSTLYPTVISSSGDHGVVDEGSVFLNRFQYTGTRDYTNFCAIGDAMDFIRIIGEIRMRKWNHELAVWAQDYLAELWGTEGLLPENVMGAMCHVRVPGGNTAEIANTLQQQLFHQYNMYTVVFELKESAGPAAGWWFRLSAQIYLERSDFENLGQAVLTILPQLREARKSVTASVPEAVNTIETEPVVSSSIVD
jgi:selenocysteine lyase/cysteine desulfurase